MNKPVQWIKLKVMTRLNQINWWIKGEPRKADIKLNYEDKIWDYNQMEINDNDTLIKLNWIGINWNKLT